MSSSQNLRPPDANLDTQVLEPLANRFGPGFQGKMGNAWHGLVVLHGHSGAGVPPMPMGHFPAGWKSHFSQDGVSLPHPISLRDGGRCSLEPHLEERKAAVFGISQRQQRRSKISPKDCLIAM